MSKIAVSPNGSGTGTYTLASPNNNASHTITLPVATGELLVNTSTGVSVTGNATFADNGKAIFGTGSDLQIYHDGSHSIITDVGTGNLYVRSNGGGILLQATTNEDSIVAVANGAVILYHDNATKLATTSTGIAVTGTVAATSYTGNGSSLTSLTSANLTGALPAIDGSALTGVGASTTAGAVGTYAWLGSNGVQTFSAGSSYAGSGLRYAGAGQYGWGFTGTAYSTTRGGTPAGTWRAMGSCGTGYSTVSPSTIFVRIS